MLIKHLRGYDCRGNSVPFATIVAVSPEKIGVAICSSKDAFNKKMGIRIAKGRAEAVGKPKPPKEDKDDDEEGKIPRGTIMTKDRICSIESLIRDEVESMKARARKYFKA